MMGRIKEAVRRAAVSAARGMDYPPEAVAAVPVVRIVGREDVYIEGCAAVLACLRERVSLDMGAFVVHIAGRGLVIRSLHSGDLILQGTVTSVTVDGKERVSE